MAIKLPPGLTPPQKKVAAKELILNGYSSRQVEAILGVDNKTALRYAAEPTPDDMAQFATIFKGWLEEQKQKGLSLTAKRMLEIIPKYARLDHLVKAAEYFEGKRDGTNVNVQVNVPILGNLKAE